jgi:hypothetical protein
MNAFGLRVDGRLMIVAVGAVVAVLVLSFAVVRWDASATDDDTGITTGISPANTVYPPRQR